MDKKTKPLIVISSCLMGQLVRYNRGHCKDEWVLEELGRFVDFYPICPEVEMGLGVPRQEVHLYYEKDRPDDLKMKNKVTGEDLTQRAYSTYDRMLTDLKGRKIDGFILTKKSPSCGIDRVKTILKDRPEVVSHKTGLFAQYIMDRYPSTPIIDDGRLHNKELRENFVKTLYAHFRFSQLEKNVAQLQKFHQNYKYILMDHSHAAVKKLGKIASSFKEIGDVKPFENYYFIFFDKIRKPPTTHKRFNTLQHLMGYFKKHINTEEKADILALLNEYKDGILNHAVAMKQLEMLAKKYKVDYLNEQFIFSPYPKELKLLKDVV